MVSKKKTGTKKAAKKKTAKVKSSHVKDSSTKENQNTKTEQATMEEDEAKDYSESAYSEEAETVSDGLLGGFANKATKIVEQAASILEEEIAAGIIAAKNVEERYVNVSQIRTDDPEKVMQRFRKDAHDVVDILLDLVNVSVNSLGGLTRRVVSVQTGPTGSKKGKTSETEGTTAVGMPTLVIPGPLKEKESGEVSMSVENDSDTSTEEFSFRCAGLLSANEDAISSANIQFSPSKVVVGPNTFEKIVVTVQVPENTQPGVYSGLLQATKLSHVQALLKVVVE